MAKDWMEERILLEKKWTSWKPKFTVRGVPLTARVAFESSWPSIEKKFVLEVRDARRGSHDIDVNAPLAKQTRASLNRHVRAALKSVPIGLCAQCKAKAILRNANLLISYLGDEPRVLLSCERCVQKSLTRAGKADAALHRNRYEAGFAWVATAVFRRRADHREYFYREFFRRRPGKLAVRAAATAHGCTVQGATTVIGRTKSYFSAG